MQLPALIESWVYQAVNETNGDAVKVARSDALRSKFRGFAPRSSEDLKLNCCEFSRQPARAGP